MLERGDTRKVIFPKKIPGLNRAFIAVFISSNSNIHIFSTCRYVNECNCIYCSRELVVMAFQWYAIQVYSGSEQAVKRGIESIAVEYRVEDKDIPQ